ncbi:MAG: C10 family peptidase [Bacteroidales bacterium]|nr:C10 family peptidase [Bacteroidales bacterium]
MFTIEISCFVINNCSITRIATGLLLLLAVDSCSLSDSIEPITEFPAFVFVKEADSPVCQKYSISINDISDYLRYKQLSKNTTLIAKSITPICSAIGDTLLYVINYEEGWEIVASDKRIPAPIAEGSESSYDFNEENPTLSWIASVAETINRVKHKDEETPNSELSRYSYNMWRAITNDIASKTQTRSDPMGHYVLGNVNSDVEVCDTVKHLTQVKWSQSSWNNNHYIILKSDSNTEHAPAGCVAVAGAQMLHFLHYAINAPETAPDSAYCSGHVGGSYYMWQGDFSSSVWSNMSTYGNLSTARLIAHVATYIETDYGDDFSGANTSDLVDLFNYHGISCSGYVDFNNSIVQNSLLNGIPVIVRAKGSANLFNLHDGHSFIIDGYIKHRTKTTYTYYWEWDDYNPEYDYDFVEDSIVVSYSSPYIYKYYMNWGWGGSHNDDSFLPDGDWEETINGNNYNFIHRRKMIYGFSNQY